MLKHGILYVGELPPPYGGVAVKNQIVYQEIFYGLPIQMIDMVICKRQPQKIPIIFFKLFKQMRIRRIIVYGLGTKQRLKVMLIAQRILCGLNNAVLLIMGGEFHTQAAKDKFLRSMLKKANSIWVESTNMVASLNEMGLSNVYLFPNCRPGKNAKKPVDCRKREFVKLVFFSRICEEKGVCEIFQAFKQLKKQKINVTLDFYGEVATNFQKKFKQYLNSNPEVVYHGVFDVAHKDVYQELNQYDVMLLPSQWRGEGIPGAIIEAKMAGITAIVSDWNYNKEVVIPDREGIVLSGATTETLTEAICSLTLDRDKLQELKEGAYISRKRYCAETYCEKFLNQIHCL